MDTCLLRDIRCRDPFLVPWRDGKILYISHDDQPDSDYEGVDARFAADGEYFAMPAPALRLPARGNTYWAPEVHAYKGAWYMLVTVTGRREGCGIRTPLGDEMLRGTCVFKAETPLGPFAPWSDGSVTPWRKLSLDGTLWVSPEGKPFMIYCHEWLQTVDGTVEAVPLTDDLRASAGGETLLFRASDAPWSKGQYVKEACGIPFDCITRVTDGVFPFADAAGGLCMLWSTGNGRYETGVARSADGQLTGKWLHADRPLYDADGGHAMLYEDKDGLYMVLHAPNGGRSERPKMIPVRKTSWGIDRDESRPERN